MPGYDQKLMSIMGQIADLRQVLAMGNLNDEQRRVAERAVRTLEAEAERIGGADPGIGTVTQTPSRVNTSTARQADDSVRPGWPWTNDMWTSAASRRGPQYKTVRIEWSKRNLGKAYFKVLRNAGSYWERREQLVQDMVLFYLEDYFKEGWGLDGSYDQAVTLMFDDGHLLTGNQKLIQVRVRLRR